MLPMQTKHTRNAMAAIVPSSQDVWVTHTMNGSADLPPLPYDGWVATKDTLPLWAQMVGKTRLADVLEEFAG